MGYYISIRFSPGQQDKINNRTYVNVYLSMNATAGYYAEHSNGTGVLTVNGQNYPFSTRYYVRGSSQVIHSVSVWIEHEPNGTKRLNIRLYIFKRDTACIMADNIKARNNLWRINRNFYK